MNIKSMFLALVFVNPVYGSHVPFQFLKEGNFASVQQPSTIFGLGQNIVNQNNAILYLSPTQTKGNNHQNFIALYPEIIYGITDYLSVDITLPIVAKGNRNQEFCGGVGDLILQWEYAFYQKNREMFSNQATLLANITLPTAHIASKNNATVSPPFGLGAPSFLLGATFSHLAVTWYAYTSYGISITTKSDNNTKFGNTLFYEGGFGRNLGNPGGITFMGMIEFEGVYTLKDTTRGIVNTNSGGNIIFCGPSFFVAHTQWALWAGIQFPLVQQLNGLQNKSKFRTLFSLSIELN